MRDVFPVLENAGSGKIKGSFRFEREERLKGRSEIGVVFRQGRRVSSRFLGSNVKLFVRKNTLQQNRICFTFSRGYGNAVKRNRVRRLEREAYRHVKCRLIPGYDLVLLVYPAGKFPCEEKADTGMETAQARIKQFESLFAKAGLLA
jgi:ribonuclease P protein component